VDQDELDLLAWALLGAAVSCLLLYVTIKAAILSAYDNIKRRESER